MSLTKVSYSMINGAPVNVMDFGAACDWNGTTGTDDTVAIQAAIDFCITNKRDMVIPGLSRITASLNINRAVDSAAADNFFTISSGNGGGLVVTTAINMFSSSLSYTAVGVTQLVKFQDLIFETNDNTLPAYVLDGNKYIRTQFVGCSFRKIKCLTVTGSGKLTQSIYFFNCQGRRWSGSFFESLFSSFDIKVHGCLFESGVQCFKLVSAVGCSFVQNSIEGMTQSAININLSQGLTIEGNYFEGSLLDIDLTAGSHLGVAILSNYFGGTVPSGAEALFWGIAERSNSLGNYSAQKLHNFISTSKVVVNDYAVTAVSNINNQTILPYNIPVLSIYLNASQSVTTATPTKVSFDTGTFDSAGSWVGASYRFKPPISGYYQISAKIYFGNATLTSAYVSIYKNGTEYQKLNSWQGSVANPIILNGSCLVFLNGSTDYAEIWGNAVGTTLSFGVASSASEASRFEAILVRV